jgi:hypothetical protein
MFHPHGSREPTDDFRKYRRQLDHRLIIAVVLVLLVGGLGLIGLFYGPMSVLTAAPFMVLGAAVLIVLFLVLAIVEKLAGDD